MAKQSRIVGTLIPVGTKVCATPIYLQKNAPSRLVDQIGTVISHPWEDKTHTVIVDFPNAPAPVRGPDKTWSLIPGVDIVAVEEATEIKALFAAEQNRANDLQNAWILQEISEWWNDGLHQVWQDELADPVKRESLFRDLATRLGQKVKKK